MTPKLPRSKRDYVDGILAGISPEIRIIYLESDYPDILSMLLDPESGSYKLREQWLGITQSDVKKFLDMRDKRICRNLADVYKETQGVGTLYTSPIYIQENEKFFYKSDVECYSFNIFPIKKRTPLPKITVNEISCEGVAYLASTHEVLSVRIEQAGTSIPETKLLYLTDADAVASSKLSAMLRAFSDSRTVFPNAKVILTGGCRNIPDTFSSRIQLIRIGAPTTEDIREEWTKRLADEREERPDVIQNWPKSKVDATQIEAAIVKTAQAMTGLSHLQVESLFSGIGSGRLEWALNNEGYIEKLIWEIRNEENEKDSTLQCRRVMDNPGIVGVDGFCRWLNERLPDLADPEQAKKFGSKPPRGVILSGVPGTGKSQMSKLVTYLWQEKSCRTVNRIEFNIGLLSSHEYGESEAKLEHFLNRIDEQAPAVLFIDEIEKVFYQDSANRSMHEVKRQQMARFLSWLQEHKSNVFTFMTSNDISILPPELIRSGRISERFFVFMPNYKELICILYSKLRGLLEKKFLDRNFRDEIEIACRIVDRYSQEASDDNKKELNECIGHCSFGDAISEMINRAQVSGQTPFMTGSDAEALVENIILRLRKIKEFTAEAFAREMQMICCEPTKFKPYGQSNMKKLARLYLSCDYQDVSDEPLLPRHLFNQETGKFVSMGDLKEPVGNEATTENIYNWYLKTKLIEAIEREAQEQNGDAEYRKKQQEIIDYQLNQYKKMAREGTPQTDK